MISSMRWVGRIAASTMALALLCGLAGEAKADVYGYSFQQLTGIAFTGGAVGTLSTVSSTSATQGPPATPVGNEGFIALNDALQSYVGPGPRPAEHTFTPIGQVNPDFGRGDVQVTAATSPTATTVAEGFLTGAGISTGNGAFTISAPITVSAAGTVTVSFGFLNQLTVVNTGVPLPASATASYDFNFAITTPGPNGTVLFESSPTAVNSSISLTALGSINSPGSGAIAITSGQLAAGTYQVSITASSRVFLNAVPEPSSLVSLGLGLLGAAGYGWKRSRRTA